MISDFSIQQAISFAGLGVFICITWILSTNRTKIDWRLVVTGIGLQLAFALAILWTTPGRWLFESLGDLFNQILSFVSSGSNFAFRLNPPATSDSFPDPELLMSSFAFGVMPTVIFFSSLMSILYHFGVMCCGCSRKADAKNSTNLRC